MEGVSSVSVDLEGKDYGWHLIPLRVWDSSSQVMAQSTREPVIKLLNLDGSSSIMGDELPVETGNRFSVLDSTGLMEDFAECQDGEGIAMIFEGW